MKTVLNAVLLLLITLSLEIPSGQILNAQTPLWKHQLDKGYYILPDGNGNVWAGSGEAGASVFKYDPNGNIIATIPTTGVMTPHVTANGLYLVSSLANPISVQCYDPAGTLLWTSSIDGEIGSSSNRTGVDASGNLIVEYGAPAAGNKVNPKLMKLSPSGQVIFSVPVPVVPSASDVAYTTSFNGVYIGFTVDASGRCWLISMQSSHKENKTGTNVTDVVRYCLSLIDETGKVVWKNVNLGMCLNMNVTSMRQSTESWDLVQGDVFLSSGFSGGAFILGGTYTNDKYMYNRAGVTENFWSDWRVVSVTAQGKTTVFDFKPKGVQKFPTAVSPDIHVNTVKSLLATEEGVFVAGTLVTPKPGGKFTDVSTILALQPGAGLQKKWSITPSFEVAELPPTFYMSGHLGARVSQNAVQYYSTIAGATEGTFTLPVDFLDQYQPGRTSRLVDNSFYLWTSDYYSPGPGYSARRDYLNKFDVTALMASRKNNGSAFQTPNGGGPTPLIFALHQNYPNPFNPSTTISFSLPDDEEHVLIAVYNELGQQIERLVDGPVSSGEHIVNWNAENKPSGIYWCRITAGAKTETRKMMLLR